MCWPAGMAQASMKRVRFRGAVLALRKLSLAFAGERSHLMGSRIQSRITVREGVSRGEGEGRLAEGRGRERERDLRSGLGPRKASCRMCGLPGCWLRLAKM